MSRNSRTVVRQRQLVWELVGYVPVAWSVCLSVLRRGPALWVLLSRGDRDRRAERSGFGYSRSALSDNELQGYWELPKNGHALGMALRGGGSPGRGGGSAGRCATSTAASEQQRRFASWLRPRQSRMHSLCGLLVGWVSVLAAMGDCRAADASSAAVVTPIAIRASSRHFRAA